MFSYLTNFSISSNFECLLIGGIMLKDIYLYSNVVLQKSFSKTLKKIEGFIFGKHFSIKKISSSDVQSKTKEQNKNKHWVWVE